MHNYINYAALVLFYHCSYQLPTKWLTFLLPQITFGPFFPTLGHVQLKEHIYSATGTNQFLSKSQNTPLRPSIQSYMVRCHIYPLLPPPKNTFPWKWLNESFSWLYRLYVRSAYFLAKSTLHILSILKQKINNVGKVFSIAKYANMRTMHCHRALNISHDFSHYQIYFATFFTFIAKKTYAISFRWRRPVEIRLETPKFRAFSCKFAKTF